MPGFRPFRGLRYRVPGPLDDLVAPPYDVIGAEERAALARRHPANAVHVELPEPDPAHGLDRYAAAAARLAAWRADGTLRADPAESLYRYRMTAADGRTTSGVVGLLRCDPEGGDVLPHEETIARDTTDRLALLRACRANLSPIWGLSLAAGLGARSRDGRPPDATAAADGVVHDLWVVDDPAEVADICEVVETAPVVVADGHHRYHTALRHAQELRQLVPPGADAEPAGWVMALVVELSPGELTVGAIHRTVHGDVLPAAVAEATAGRFTMTPVPGPEPPGSLLLVTPDRCWSLRASAATVAAAGTDLDPATVREVTATLAGATVGFEADRDRAVAAVASGAAVAAFLLRPVPVGTIGEWAASRRRMPPKSTYFSPKPRTGMVYRAFDPAGPA